MRAHRNKLGLTSRYTNRVDVATLDDQSLVVFKFDTKESLIAEHAAFQASLFLGFPKIPTTALTFINEELCTAQEYISSHVNQKPFFTDDADTRFNDEFSNYLIFRFVMGSWDTNIFNYIIQDDGMLWCIDNAKITDVKFALDNHREAPFVRKTKIISVQRSKPNKFQTMNEQSESFPFHTASQSTAKEFSKKFKNYLPAATLKELCPNIAEERLPFSYVTYNGYLWIKNLDKNQPNNKRFDFSQLFSMPYSEKSIIALKSLDANILKSFFAPYEIANHVINDILKRRDIIITVYEEQQKSISL